MKKILEGKNLSKEYVSGNVITRALEGVSFEIYEGELLIILGPSGSGKSTLLNLIGGIDQASFGELYFGDIPIHSMKSKELSKYRRDVVGFVFQFYNLIPNLTALENVSLAGELSKNPLKAEEILEEIGLKDRANHFPSQLSGGEQQRVAIARALVKNTPLILCDEPTGALDSKTGKDVLNLLQGFCKKHKKTVAIITHNSEIKEMGDRVFYIRDGKIESIIANKNPISANEVKL